MKDHYKILGIPFEATASEIRKAYYALAQKYHPDKNAGSQIFEEKFKEINEAYEILLNPNERHYYDDLYRYIILKDQEIYHNFEGFNVELNNENRIIARKYFMYFFISAIFIAILLIAGIKLSNSYSDKNSKGFNVTINDKTGNAKRTLNGLSIDLTDTTNLILAETTRVGNKISIKVTIDFKHKKIDNSDSLYIPIQELL